MSRTARTFLALATVALSMTTTAVTAADRQTVDDQMQIEQLYARYVYALDTLDPDAYAAVFTPDAYLDNAGQKLKGEQAIRGLILDYIARFGAGRGTPDSHGRRFSGLRHVVTSLKLDVQGNSARAESYWLEVIATGKPSGGTEPAGAPLSLFNGGRTEDELVKRNGKWLISSRIILADWVPQGAPPAQPPAAK